MEVDEADGLLGRPSAGAGDARDGDPDVGAEPLAHAGGHRRGRLGRNGSVTLERRRRHAEKRGLDAVGVGDDRPEKHVAGAGHVGQPRRDQAARARFRRREREAALAAKVEDELGDRALVLREQVDAETFPKRSRKLVRPSAGAVRGDEVDVDLEIAGADRHVDSFALAARLTERPRHLGLARPVEAEHAPLRRLRAREHALDRLGRERAGPQPAQLGRRARQHDEDAAARVEDTSGRRAGEAERDGALGQRGLLLDARLEVGVRSAQPLRDPARNRLDLPLETWIADELAARHERDQLDRPVVVSRPEAAGDDAEVGRRALPQRRLQLGRRVSDDDDALRLEAQRPELSGQERPVQVLPVAADELAAGDDDDRAATPYRPLDH